MPGRMLEAVALALSTQEYFVDSRELNQTVACRCLYGKLEVQAKLRNARFDQPKRALGLVRRRHEHVAHASDSPDSTGMRRIDFDLAAQTRNS